jgi:cupredoxin-like protein
MKLITILIMASLLLQFGVARAEEGVVPLAVEDGAFVPAEVEGPAATRFRLEVTNRTSAAIEFESFALNRERVVQPGQTVAIYLSGLTFGRYEFFDDFHQERRGTLVIR